MDVVNWQAIARTIAELTKDVVSDLRRKGLWGRTVTIKIRYSDFRTVTRACSSRDVFGRDDEIRRLAFSCLKRVDLVGKKVRLIGIRVTNLEKVENVPLPV